MQRVIIFIFWSLFAIVVQSVVLSDFPSVRIWTDLIFYLVIILGLRFGLATGVIVAGVLGYIADTASLAPYGTATISYVVTFLFIRTVKANIFIENRLALFFWIAVFSVVRQAVQILYLTISARNLDLSATIILHVAFQSLWDALLGILIIPLIEKMMTKDWGMLFRRRSLR